MTQLLIKKCLISFLFDLLQRHVSSAASKLSLKIQIFAFDEKIYQSFPLLKIVSRRIY